MRGAAAVAVSGLVLAGGRSSRFGREKAVTVLRGRPLIAWVAERLAGVCPKLAVSARPGSGAAAWAEAAGHVVLPDPEDGRLADGPLAGVLEGLRWAEKAGVQWLATAPCDAPGLPSDLYARLLEARTAGGAVARTRDGLQPLCALWPVTARARLERLDVHPPVKRMLTELGAAEVGFEDGAAFANLNTPEALAAAEARLR